MKEKTTIAKHVIARVLACGFAALPIAASAVSVDDCQALAGFNAAGVQGGAAAIINTQGDLGAFLTRNATICTVKYVQPSAKAKPQTVNLTLDGNALTPDTIDPMKTDECSLYRDLSSIHSKLGQAKLADAYSGANLLNAKVDDFRNTGRLTESGWAAIKPATAELLTCVTTLINQP